MDNFAYNSYINITEAKFMNLKRLEISLLIAFVVLVTAGQITSFAKDCDDIRGNTLRLHIMANSDSEYDQKVKLHIKDFVLEKYGEELGKSENLILAKLNTKSILNNIQDDIDKELFRIKAPYKSDCKIVNMYFNTRYYDNFTMAAGMYDALRVNLGEGTGKNWWCVMYPPLCLGTSLDKYSDEEEKIIQTSGEYNFIPKFAVVELWENLKKKLHKTQHIN